MTKNFLNKKISGEYIAGFVQADGSFSAVLTSKTKNSKRYFNISLVFTIVQHEKYKDLILDIQKYFGGIGNWYFNKSDKTIRYQVTKQSDLLNVIIPFFMKHQLRDQKLLGFLRFKYIAEIVSSKIHLKNKNILLGLIVIAGQIKPNDRLGNKIRYLKPDQIYYVINNIQPEGVDISKLMESIENFKLNPLSIDFVHGLVESNSNNYKKVSKLDQDFIRDNFLPEGVQLYQFKEYYLGLSDSRLATDRNPCCAPQNKINKQQRRFYSEEAINKQENPDIDGGFISGFSDGEGCFYVSISKTSKRKIGWSVQLVFSIGVHEQDLNLLIKIQKFLTIGKISKLSKSAYQYRITSLEDSALLLEHFEKFPLITRKWSDYQLWKQVFYLVKAKEHLTKEGFLKILALKASMNRGLSEEFKTAFLDIIPINLPVVSCNPKISKSWMRGFTSAEGCFYVLASNNQVKLTFQITQHSKDEQLMKSLIEFFESGYISYRSSEILDYRVTKFSEIENKIVPFFKKNPILGVKSKDFDNFCKVVELMKKKKHLTQPGLEQIRKIKAEMNREKN